MARYMLTGIDDDLWKRFKAACNLRGCTIKQSFIDHINIIVTGFNSEVHTTIKPHTAPKKGGKRK